MLCKYLLPKTNLSLLFGTFWNLFFKYYLSMVAELIKEEPTGQRFNSMTVIYTGNSKNSS